MKSILITGATGLVGKPLCKALAQLGHTIRTVSRGIHGDFQWDVDKGQLDPNTLEGVDVVIHLAGETVAQRWSEPAKKRILNSRVDSTKLLVDAILKQEKRPAFISASGISYYGIQADGPVDESTPSGDGFLAEVTRQWEGAAQPLIDAGVRVAYMRTGIVLSREGGALAKMLTPFKFGVGGRIGSGEQLMSWISLPDLVNAFVFVVENENVAGPINAVAPQPASNLGFTKTLGFVIGRPTIFPIPTAIIKILFGEMGEETVLSDLGVLPQRLTQLGFKWQNPNLEQTLRETIYIDS
ncbi:MAG: TIGR01777 family oxidoreductase [Opitutaceae bacterium]